MVRKLINLAILLLVLLNCVDITYRANVDWNLTVINKRSCSINVLIINDTTDDKWTKPDRHDDYSQNRVRILQDSTFNFKLKLSNDFFCENPYVESPTQYLYHIVLDSANFELAEIAINLFPFPEFANYNFCSSFVEGDSAMYECNNSYFDTVLIFTDSVYSTTNYFNWSNYRIVK